MQSIDAATDKLITLGEATKNLPKRPSPATLWRWQRKGSGGKILQTWRIGGRVYTTREAFQDFITVVRPFDEPSPDRSPETEAKLRDAGLI